MSECPRKVRKARMASHPITPKAGAMGTPRDAAAVLDDFFVGGFGVHVPLPSVFEGHDLRGGTGAVALGEEHVVVLAAVKGRVEVDEIDGFVLDVVAKDGEIVAVIEVVLLHRRQHSTADFSAERFGNLVLTPLPGRGRPGPPNCSLRNQQYLPGGFSPLQIAVRLLRFGKRIFMLDAQLQPARSDHAEDGA